MIMEIYLLNNFKGILSWCILAVQSLLPVFTKHAPKYEFVFHLVAEKFARLQVAKMTLTDPEARLQYDQWKRSGVAIRFEEWKARKDSIHTVRERNVTPKKKQQRQCQLETLTERVEKL